MKTSSIQTVIYSHIAVLIITSMVHIQAMASTIKEETVTYTSGGVTLKGFMAYDERAKGKRPAVLVVPEWWGLNEYAKMRARELAGLGYIAMAVDMFGNGAVAADPKQAQEYTKPFYQDPELAKTRLDAAMEKLKENPQVDPGRIAAIGYCFGGYVVMNAAKLGANLNGVVSFHGGYGGAPVEKNLLKANLLICQGAIDKYAPLKAADAFVHQLDSIGAHYTFKVYPNATKLGQEFNLSISYNAAADKASWNDMKVFLAGIFKTKK
jgi:dienelactone hydrolase